MSKHQVRANANKLGLSQPPTDSKGQRCPHSKPVAQRPGSQASSEGPVKPTDVQARRLSNRTDTLDSLDHDNNIKDCSFAVLCLCTHTRPCTRAPAHTRAHPAPRLLHSRLLQGTRTCLRTGNSSGNIC